MNNNKYLALFEKIYGAKILYDDNGGNPYYIGPLSTVGVNEPRTRFYVNIDPDNIVSGLDEVLAMIGVAVSRGVLDKVSISIEGTWVIVNVNKVKGNKKQSKAFKAFNVFESGTAEKIINFLNEVI